MIFKQNFSKILIGLSPIWFVCMCVGSLWHFKHVLRHFSMWTCIVHSCSAVLHAKCLSKCSSNIFVLLWTQMSSNFWEYPWLNLVTMFWSLGVCFTHYAQFVPHNAMPCHAPPRHTLGTHHASPHAH